MKKLIKIVFFLIFLYIGAYTIWTILEKKATPLSILIKAQYSFSDRVQLFYTFGKDSTFTENRSINYKIIGNTNEQEIKFTLPLSDEKLSGLRLDISSNHNQKPIYISSITFQASNNKVDIYKNIQSLFTTNENVKFENQKFLTSPINGKYDPFLIYTGSFEEIDKLLSVNRNFLSNIFAIAIVFIFCVFLYYLIFNFTFNYSKRTIARISLIGVFVFILFTPLVLNPFKKKESISKIENRKLKEKPEYRFSKEFFSEYEEYYNDNFIFRDALISMHTSLKTNIFRASPFPDKVLFGKNKFLFNNTQESYVSYSKRNLLPPDRLGMVVKTFTERKEALFNKGIKYYFGFFPNKETIYYEYLPKAMKIQIKDTISLATQLKVALAKKNFDFFDPTEQLLNAKKNSLLYLKLDTHWNNEGAYETYKSFFEYYQDLGIQPLSKNDFSIRYTNQTFGDLTKLMGTEKIYGYDESRPLFEVLNKEDTFKRLEVEDLPRLAIHTLNENIDNKQRVLFFGDSFSDNIVGFFSLHFNEVIYLRDSYNQAMVDKINPDIIIEIPVERFIYKHFPKFN
ncbi:hypothetical protein LS48_04370 [Aequorivita aquimaris]|uniref:AlgX/AlgJ SGNH hydrolase-like domain-containing protein n=2 Tax=Flavobacteriaceae TaxID=49546 RepID=A0A137RKB7_9FLAO|nr:hypothetical protein [Aequorivita aquimaris]KXO00631.1 hypothetical protein LS48_04370 [Aequorivita aquimaris]